MEKTIIFGNGFLGQRLASTWPEAKLSPVDIADRSAVEQAIREFQPKVVVNAAGKTGKPNVDWCENHPIETYRSNVVGPLVLAEVCAQSDCYLLHLGSGCVFYGESPHEGGAWAEDDFANPISTYSKTKYAADMVLSTLPHVGIARLRMPIDDQPGARNLITKLANYPKVIDVENSVTVVEDLVYVVGQLVKRKAAGIYHVTNPGTMRHRDLLDLYRKLVNPEHQVEMITSEQLLAHGLAQKARSNCILSSARLEGLGIHMRPIDMALRATMESYATNLQAR
jgi:dTDP-4-dehydrorhamnose reductase